MALLKQFHITTINNAGKKKKRYSHIAFSHFCKFSRAVVKVSCASNILQIAILLSFRTFRTAFVVTVQLNYFAVQ